MPPKQNIPIELRTNIRVFRMSGMWPTPTDTQAAAYRYDMLSVCVLLFIGISFPLSQIINVFLVHSVDDMMDHLFISLTIICGTVKGINIYCCRRRIQQIFDLHHEMMSKGYFDHRLFANVRGKIQMIFRFFVVMYMSAWIFVGLYNVISVRGKRFWPATHHLHGKWTDNEFIYWTVFVYQAMANFCFCGWHAMEDTMSVILMLLLCGHIEVLMERFRCLGQSDGKLSLKNRAYYENLKNCCAHYELCLKYANM